MATVVPGAAAVIVVIMGVSGAGKTTVGKLLAERLNADFLDADDFHSESNKEKMRNGIPLTDEDRMPWLVALCNALRQYIASGRTVVLACSALRKKYREILRTVDPSYYSLGVCCDLVKFVLLDVSAAVLADRLHRRVAEGKHFMPATLLQSQLDLLEVEAIEGILQVDGTLAPSTIASIIQNLTLR